ncbi:hypothetical protein BTHE68_71920 (plasmid) [Burkholderia sp. THE68]|nr:hypothetical protein BTHE68_71370 [Burkholderia sp. THE68]BBU33458.1 hypothetical protein BTHE68_71920 [Burkholderia sp. THE68]
MIGCFECAACRKVTPLFNDKDELRCSICQSTDGTWRSPEDCQKMLDAGVYFNILAKKTKRQK